MELKTVVNYSSFVGLLWYYMYMTWSSCPCWVSENSLWVISIPHSDKVHIHNYSPGPHPEDDASYISELIANQLSSLASFQNLILPWKFQMCVSECVYIFIKEVNYLDNYDQSKVNLSLANPCVYVNHEWAIINCTYYPLFN